MRTFLLIIVCLVIASSLAQVMYKGVNQCGAEFGEILPGEYGTDYKYPTEQSADYFISKNMNTFRLPFKWERLQSALQGALNVRELARMDNFVNYATGKGAFILLDVHNHARYLNFVIGKPIAAADSGARGVTLDDFADLWKKLALHYKDNPNIMFGIMNEPYNMETELWRSAAQAAIDAIRSAGASNIILVPGNAWTGAQSWFQDWYGTPNAYVMVDLNDPENNTIYEIHQYLDQDYSGTNATCQNATIGANGLAVVTPWLRERNAKGFLAEFSAPDNDVCKAALDNMLQYMEQNDDVWIGWTFWAAGPMWVDYMSSIEPKDGIDAPQMEVISKYLSYKIPIGTTTSNPLQNATTASSSSQSTSTTQSSATGTQSSAQSSSTSTSPSSTSTGTQTTVSTGVEDDDHASNSAMTITLLIPLLAASLAFNL